MYWMPILIWFTSQIWWLFFIRFNANQQIPMLKGYRQYVPESDSSEDGFHKWGAIKSAWIAVPVITLQIIFSGWYSLLFIPILVAQYWDYFDKWINKGLNNPDGYLGNESWWDQKLQQWFGASVGKRKDVICDWVVVVCDSLYLLLFVFLN